VRAGPQSVSAGGLVDRGKSNWSNPYCGGDDDLHARLAHRPLPAPQPAGSAAV